MKLPRIRAEDIMPDQFPLQRLARVSEDRTEKREKQSVSGLLLLALRTAVLPYRLQFRPTSAFISVEDAIIVFPEDARGVCKILPSVNLHI